MESDDDFQYEEVEILEDEEEDNLSEDLESALRNLGLKDGQGKASSDDRRDHSGEPAPGETVRGAEVVDDFVRNFLLRMGMERTLDVFEEEWYRLRSQGQVPDVGNVPDVYVQNQAIDRKVRELSAELDAVRAVASKATGTWDKLRKERDFHRMNHRRVAQEKNRLINDVQRLKKHCSLYEPTIAELRSKYEAAMKEKMLMRLERDRLAAKVEALEALVRQLETTKVPGGALPEDSRAEEHPGSAGSPTGLEGTNGPRTKPLAGASLSATARPNPFSAVQFPRTEVKTLRLARTIKAHDLPVPAMALHPTKPILVTASDDKTWKMWHLNSGDLIMTGEGHRDWVAGVDFHPRGTHLASASGDSTVKIWDFERQRCVLTFTTHSQAVWDVAFHDTGSFVASCSLDHSARLWDLTTAKCRQVFKGHVDSVNACCWQPYTNVLTTASSDKTVSLWDARTGLCTQTFYGHHNSVNHVTFDLRGTRVASTDADGVVKVWDVRMVAESMSTQAGLKPLNKAAFDRSGEILAVTSDDGKVRCLDSSTGATVTELSGHEDTSQAVLFDPGATFLVSSGGEGSFKMFQ